MEQRILYLEKENQVLKKAKDSLFKKNQWTIHKLKKKNEQHEKVAEKQA